MMTVCSFKLTILFSAHTKVSAPKTNLHNIMPEPRVLLSKMPAFKTDRLVRATKLLVIMSGLPVLMSKLPDSKTMLQVLLSKLPVFKTKRPAFMTKLHVTKTKQPVLKTKVVAPKTKLLAFMSGVQNIMSETSVTDTELPVLKTGIVASRSKLLVIKTMTLAPKIKLATPETKPPAAEKNEAVHTDNSVCNAYQPVSIATRAGCLIDEVISTRALFVCLKT